MLRAGLGAVTRLQALQTARYSHLHFTVPDDEGSRIPFVKSRAALRRLGMTIWTRLGEPKVRQGFSFLRASRIDLNFAASSSTRLGR